MSITGSPMDRGRHEDGDETSSSEPPPDDWDAQFSAIVSGISQGAQWTVAEPESEKRDKSAKSAGGAVPYMKAPDTIWRDAIAEATATETAEERRLRRDARRREREADYAAFAQAQEEIAAAYAADTEHYEPPEPPPLPRPHRRTVAGIALLVLGVLVLVTPTIIPGSLEFSLITALVAIVGGVWLIISARRQQPPRPVVDDGAEV